MYMVRLIDPVKENESVAKINFVNRKVGAPQLIKISFNTLCAPDKKEDISMLGLAPPVGIVGLG